MNIRELLEFDITEELNFNSEKEKENFLSELGAIFIDNLLNRAIPQLKKDSEKEFDELLAKDNTKSEEILAFLAERVPNFADILGDEIIRTKEEALTALGIN